MLSWELTEGCVDLRQNNHAHRLYYYGYSYDQLLLSSYYVQGTAQDPLCITSSQKPFSLR